ncbi:MAG TPA: BlaI/MecI/CopY family transcriptional regulator [Capsulimonadaceae bacterium]|nr:BlaI/MecI/CopY family transcriptional regulator [Capsulimonadaceae bacterium]
MRKQQTLYLNPREQQIMELVYQRERVTAAELEAALPGAPSNSTVRTLLRILEKKGHLKHIEEEGRFVYLPAHPKRAAAKSALDNVLRTFFQGSVEQAFATLLTSKEAHLTEGELDRLAALISQAKESGS